MTISAIFCNSRRTVCSAGVRFHEARNLPWAVMICSANADLTLPGSEWLPYAVRVVALEVASWFQRKFLFINPILSTGITKVKTQFGRWTNQIPLYNNWRCQIYKSDQTDLLQLRLLRIKACNPHLSRVLVILLTVFGRHDVCDVMTWRKYP